MSTPKNVMKNAKSLDSDSDDDGYVVDFSPKRFIPLSYHDLLELNPSYRKLTFSELKKILEKQKQDLDRNLDEDFDRELEKDKVTYRKEVTETFNKPIELIEDYISKGPAPEDPISLPDPIPLYRTATSRSCRGVKVVRVEEVDEDAELARALALSLETYEQQNGLKESKAGEDGKESSGSIESKESKESTEGKVSKESTAGKESKERIEGKVSKEGTAGKESTAGKENKVLQGIRETDYPSSDWEAFNAMDFYTEMSLGKGSKKEIDWEIELAKERVRTQTPRSFNGPD